MQKKTLNWNPGKVCFGLSRIGYKPHEAICDLVDNSISAAAKNIRIIIVKENEDFNDTRKDNVKEYLIIDDGSGMDEEGILNALELGSDDSMYDENTLSKFGLGLKSASFSQGKLLEIISSNSSNEFKKKSIDLEEIKNEYFCTENELNDEDEKLIQDFLTENRGTIIRIGKIRKGNHPSIKKTVDELKYKLGAIYYYFITDDNVNIYIENEKIEAYDVLHIDEAEKNGNLNEHEWKGTDVSWIEKPRSIILDSEEQVKATIEATQLPHPPSCEMVKGTSKTQFRDAYKISAGNYGYYVYRNKRLISWAESFSGIIPQDQDFYSFRGRILIDSTADDCFNIDVKKSSLILSDEAHDIIDDLSSDYKRKSKKAWNNAKENIRNLANENPDKKANEIASKIILPDAISSTSFLDENSTKEAKKREESLIDDSRKIAREKAILDKGLSGENVESEITDEELAVAIKGTSEENDNRKIFRVENVTDGCLWEPYYDADHGASVRINENHRFSKLIYGDNSDNVDMQIIYDIMVLTLAQAEILTRKNYHDYKKEEIERILFEYRTIASNCLMQLCRNNDIILPPIGEQ